MTREEFMDTVDKKMQELLSFLHDSITDLIAQAYMEGQKEAKIEQILEFVRAVCNRMDTANAESESEPKMCSCWHRVQIGTLCGEPVYEQRCWGTKEQDICTCGGDKSKCNFYEKVKQND